MAEHAASGKVLKERVLTPAFLPYVDVGRLRRLLPQARVQGDTDEGRWLAAWRQVAHRWRWEAPAANRAALNVAAAALGLPVDPRPGQYASEPLQTAWRVRWAAWALSLGGNAVAGHYGLVGAVALEQSEGRLVLATGSKDRTARLWDATTGDPLGPPLPHNGSSKAVALATFDGRLVLATGSDDNTARLWDPTTGDPLGPPLRQEGWVRAQGLATRNERLVLATSGDDNTLRLWDPTSGHQLAEPLHIPGEVADLAIF